MKTKTVTRTIGTVGAAIFGYATYESINQIPKRPDDIMNYVGAISLFFMTIGSIMYVVTGHQAYLPAKICSKLLPSKKLRDYSAQALEEFRRNAEKQL